ncbi:response regulator [Sorangium cellulosum]|uniref:response regulator n=1 Tax=Sorangium cellulosum TaxID=56 RepID=UPI000CF3AB9B|nr:response regulator [Sorangium cellulosum]
MLVVDDDDRALDGITAVLSPDVDVVTCSSAEHALRLLEARRFHLVCSDFMMPGMKGDELLRRVASMSLYTSCLLVTGADEYMRSKDQSQNHVILKPFDPARLIGIVLQLARLAEMKRSVHSMADSLGWAGPAGVACGGEMVSCEAPDASASPDSTPAPSTSRLGARAEAVSTVQELQQGPELTRSEPATPGVSGRYRR